MATICLLGQRRRKRAAFDAQRREFLQFASRLHKLGCDLQRDCQRFQKWSEGEFDNLLTNLAEEDAAHFVGNLPGYLRSAGRLIRDVVNHPLLGEELDVK